MKDFLTHDHPYFQPGSVWIRADGTKYETTIRRVAKFGDGKYDYEVFHGNPSGDREYTKDIWNFQVRYTPKI